jgi:hypothetical protein
MEDWRYDNLREDIKRLQEELYEVRGRTSKLENWKSFLPMRVWFAILWLAIICMWIAGIADAAGAF